MTTIVAGFLVGVASSVAAAWLITSSRRLRKRLTFRGVLHNVQGLFASISSDGFSPEYIVAVDRNSGVVGSILAGEFGLSAIVSVSTINSRTTEGARLIHLDPVHEVSLKELGGRRVLVLICCNDSGTSLQHVVDALLAQANPPAEVRTAALFSTQSPKLKPRYVGATAGIDFKLTMPQILQRLPWVDKHWKLQLASERGSKPAGPPG
jgi:hypoxanthine phosphoribosyltransferase